jgi:GxxExxY protein
MELKCAETTGRLIDLFYFVYRKLGHGFLEGVYSNALMISGKEIGLEIKQAQPIRVYFEGKEVGYYRPDLIVNESVIVELKACRALVPKHEAQLLNYLKATQYEVGFLFNFGPKAQYKRMVFDNKRK